MPHLRLSVRVPFAAFLLPFPRFVEAEDQRAGQGWPAHPSSAGVAGHFVAWIQCSRGRCRSIELPVRRGCPTLHRACEVCRRAGQAARRMVALLRQCDQTPAMDHPGTSQPLSQGRIAIDGLWAVHHGIGQLSRRWAAGRNANGESGVRAWPGRDAASPERTC